MYPKTRGLALSASFAVLLGMFSLVSIPIPFDLIPITLQILECFFDCCASWSLLWNSVMPHLFDVRSGRAARVSQRDVRDSNHSRTYWWIPCFLSDCDARWRKYFPESCKDEKNGYLMRVAAGFAISLVIIYSLGTVWLMEYLNLTLVQACPFGYVPFVGFDILKAMVAAPIAVRLRTTRYDLPVNRISKVTNSILAEQTPSE